MIEPIFRSRAVSRLSAIAGDLAFVLPMFCASFLGPAPCDAQQRTRLINQESPLNDAHYGPGAVALVISPDGSHGCAVFRDGDALAVIDGYPGHSYDKLAPGMPILSPDGVHCAYVARRSTASPAAPDNPTDKWFVVFDGAESAPFPLVNGDSPIFSPDGSRLAVVVRTTAGKDAACFFTVPPPRVLGPAETRPTSEPTTFPAAILPRLPLEPRKPKGEVPKLGSATDAPFDEIASASLRFSPDNRHLAYSARRDKKWRIVLDGNDAGGTYDEVGCPAFCGSGAVLGYVARREGKSVVATIPIGVAGAIAAEGRAHDSIAKDSLSFSFDGSHLAYATGKAGAMTVCVDGSEVAMVPRPGVAATFEQVAGGSLTFCAEGSHLAFAASRDGQWFVVLDGVEGPHFLGIVPTPPVFSQNGKRLAYVAEVLVADVNNRPSRTGRCVVVDGIPQAVYDRVVAGPVFSPDGRRCAYVAGRGGQSFVVIDGMEGKRYGCLRGPPVLSIDGSRCAMTAVADDPDNRFLAVEEVPRSPSDPAAGARLIFDRSPDFRSLSPQRQTNPVKLLLVEERVSPE